MKVMHIFGGIRTFKIAKWQADQGIDVHNVIIEDEKPFEAYFKNTSMTLHKNNLLTKIYERIKGKKLLFFRMHMLLYPFYLRLISKAIRQQNPDIVHAYRHTGALLAIISKKLHNFKSKIVFDYQDPWRGEDMRNKSIFHKFIVDTFYKFEKFIINNSDLVITQGEEQTEMLKKRHNLQDSKFSYTINTADTNVFKVYTEGREELRKSYGIDDTAILYLGSIVDSHGVGMLPKAAKEVLEEFPKTKFIMLGVIRDKAYWESLKKEIKSYGIWDNFVEIYPDKKGDIPKYVSMCDIGLILHKKGSAISEVAIPSKLFEYMSCGLAIVTSNLKHITRFVLPENAGVAFEPNSTDSLVETLKALIKNPERMMMLGKNARKAAETKYNWDADMERLLKAYESLIK
ncbi:MAG: glycosyltransferase family 4 protein [Candidatus Nanoarchaeia archaeon]|nr:glycosyltransferase family 4 protein [Candidatus Nanoarchaeia archaeon]MDD5239265.1 glycosyltransferase family 4 protein [Candidatus Nanoarchaeia archaeon]